MRSGLLTAIVFVGLVSSGKNLEILETVAQWSMLDFALPYDQAYLNAFRPNNVVPTGIEVAWDRIFISIPRLRAGVPATLGVIPRNIPLGSSPQLQAYPSWGWHPAGKGDVNCSTLISSYRTRLDKCNRLWVLDAGVMTSLDDFRPICSPKLLVFNLQSDQVERQFVFPREVLRPHSLLTNLVIDDSAAKTCDDVFVYMSDTTGSGLVVLDAATEKSWRLSHASMYPNPDLSTYQIGEDTFELFDGIVGLTYSPKMGMVYYQPLATDRLFGVPTSALQAGPLPFGQQLPVNLIGRKSSQGIALAVDPRDDTIIFSPLTETAIASWQPQTNEQRILAYSADELQFVADLRATERDSGNIWVLSSRFQKFFLNRANPRDVNIRILRIRPIEARKVVEYRRNNIPPYYQHYYNNTLGF